MLEEIVRNDSSTSHPQRPVRVNRDETDLPPLSTVGEVAALVADEDIGLIELEVEIAGWGTMSSHDDAECAFTILARSDLMAILARVIAPEQLGKMVNILLQRSGQ